MREAVSFCRICLAQCGITATIDDEERLTSIRGDKDNPLTRGYACNKGIDSWAMHRRDDRILRSLKRGPEGDYAEISLEQATAEIAVKLDLVRTRHGPGAIALYSGTASYFNTTLTKLLPAFTHALGTPNRFTPLTIDASSRVVTASRMGVWSAGRQRFDSADVWLMFGINPVVSPRSNGVPPFNPTKGFKTAKKRGMSVIVVDPRETETARYADIHLQVKPGGDAALAAALLHVLLTEGLHDEAFCTDYVEGIERLREAVAPFTPEAVTDATGIKPDQIVAAARMFGGSEKRGCADPGTGITMSRFSNLTDHMVELLNVVCGRFVAAGEPVANPMPLSPARIVRAGVVRPPRTWESGYRMKAGGYGMIHTEEGGELPTSALADEILLEGEGRIRALLSIGGNPASAFPDQNKVVSALKRLDLLVAVEPFPTATARLADYVIAPRLMFERPDVPIMFGQGTRVPEPFAQYTPAIVPPPSGSEVTTEWRFIWDLARRLGLDLEINGAPIDMDQTPSDDAILELVTANAQVPLSEVRQHPHGAVFEMEQIVQPPEAGSASRFEVMPDDVIAELEAYRSQMNEPSGDQPFRLTGRRMRQAMNSLVSAPQVLDPKKRFNPAYLHSATIERLGLVPGQRISISSRAGTINGSVEIDDGLRTDIVSMSHCWGGLPDDPDDAHDGAGCTSRLVDTNHAEPINAMPRMTGIPVSITPV